MKLKVVLIWGVCAENVRKKAQINCLKVFFLSLILSDDWNRASKRPHSRWQLGIFLNGLFPPSLNIFYVCIFRSGWLIMCLFVHVCTCMYARDRPLVSFLMCSPPGLLLRLGWLASNPQASTCLSLAPSQLPSWVAFSCEFWGLSSDPCFAACAISAAQRCVFSESICEAPSFQWGFPVCMHPGWLLGTVSTMCSSVHSAFWYCSWHFDFPTSGLEWLEVNLHDFSTYKLI